TSGVTHAHAREQVVRIIGEGEGEVVQGQIPFTPRAKKVLELSLREARSMGHNYIGTEHVLLALGRESDGVGARILQDFGAGPETVRRETMGGLTGPGGGAGG